MQNSMNAGSIQIVSLSIEEIIIINKTYYHLFVVFKSKFGSDQELVPHFEID